MRAIERRLARLEREAPGNPRDDLTDGERALVRAHFDRCAEREGRGIVTDEQRALLAEPGSWRRLQEAFGKPAFAGRLVEALDRARRERMETRRAVARGTAATW